MKKSFPSSCKWKSHFHGQTEDLKRKKTRETCGKKNTENKLDNKRISWAADFTLFKHLYKSPIFQSKIGNELISDYCASNQELKRALEWKMEILTFQRNLQQASGWTGESASERVTEQANEWPSNEWANERESNINRRQNEVLGKKMKRLIYRQTERQIGRLTDRKRNTERH